MNWTNYDRLVRHLETMPPEDFNYMNGYVVAEEAGCVDCQCRVLMGLSVHGPSERGKHIAIFLGVTADEARQLWVPGGGPHLGAEAIANALHRLNVVASKYTRSAISVNPETIEQRERAFVLRCMETASQPLPEEVK